MQSMRSVAQCAKVPRTARSFRGRIVEAKPCCTGGVPCCNALYFASAYRTTDVRSGLCTRPSHADRRRRWACRVDRGTGRRPAGSRHVLRCLSSSAYRPPAARRGARARARCVPLPYSVRGPSMCQCRMHTRCAVCSRRGSLPVATGARHEHDDPEARGAHQPRRRLATMCLVGRLARIFSPVRTVASEWRSGRPSN
jgi:hypothetical protein